MDAIEMLKKEHKGAKGAMEEIVRTTGPKRKQMFEALMAELKTHDSIEERIFYPAVQNNPKAAGFKTVDKQAHEEVEAALNALQRLPNEDKNWLGAFKVMQTKLLKHVADEETRIFVTISTILTPIELSQLGEKMKAEKELMGKVQVGATA